jgi:hypothetical protein
VSDPFAPLKENAWREVQEIDARPGMRYRVLWIG